MGDREKLVALQAYEDPNREDNGCNENHKLQNQRYHFQERVLTPPESCFDHQWSSEKGALGFRTIAYTTLSSILGRLLLKKEQPLLIYISQVNIKTPGIYIRTTRKV